jgi:hypothetical protein
MYSQSERNYYYPLCSLAVNEDKATAMEIYRTEIKLVLELGALSSLPFSLSLLRSTAIKRKAGRQAGSSKTNERR